MIERSIEYKNKVYPIQEPTIKTWMEVMKYRDLLDENELLVKVLELSTGLSQEEILEADAAEIKEAGQKLFDFIVGSNKNLIREFNHKGVDYEFVDINNISFGQFIDIDTYFNKDENYRIQNLNELAAYLFTEKGSKYGEHPQSIRQNEFLDLPVKYLEGATFFLLSSVRASEVVIEIYSKSKWLKVMTKLKIISHLIGVGIKQSVLSAKTRFGYLGALLLSPFFSVSIISVTLWTLIKRKKD